MAVFAFDAMAVGSAARIVQAAAIPYRWSQGRMEVALITRREGDAWLVPKGHVEEGESPRRSARREAAEEAGLYGKVGPHPIGKYETVKNGAPCVVEVYLLRVKRARSRWSEDHLRERRWVRVERAAGRVRERGLRLLLRDLARRPPA